MANGMRTKRKICWPNPDATCLSGGCIHCEAHPYRSLNTIRTYARNAGMLKHRAHGQENAFRAYEYGLLNAHPSLFK